MRKMNPFDLYLLGRDVQPMVSVERKITLHELSLNENLDHCGRGACTSENFAMLPTSTTGRSRRWTEFGTSIEIGSCTLARRSPSTSFLVRSG